MRRVIMLFCLTLCLLTACGQSETGTVYQLYFTLGSDVPYGDSIVSEDYIVAEGDYLNVGDMLSDLFDGPNNASLDNPFPSNTRLIWASWRSDGVLTLNLTEEYSGLTGISLTLADYCIVRTVCQIEGVTGVEILSANQQNQFRNHPILTLEDVL